MAADSVIDTRQGPTRTFSGRTAAIFLVLVGAVVLLCRGLDPEQASGAALKVVSATVALGIIPGVLVTLLLPPRRTLSLLEAIGFGIAISFGLLHVVTTIAMSAHLSPGFMLVVIGIASAIMAGQLIRKTSVSIVVSLDELIVLVLVLLLAVPLYLQGSPFDMYEDQVLAAIVRRLSELQAPRLDNLFVAPGIVYTYPFPSVLYFLGLVARLGDVDPLFVYHKLRFFWGPAALVMLYLAARAVFGYASVACAVTVTAVVFVCSGVFGTVESFPAWWGQLVPYNYVPDIAMTVLLPALARRGVRLFAGGDPARADVLPDRDVRIGPDAHRRPHQGDCPVFGLPRVFRRGDRRCSRVPALPSSRSIPPCFNRPRRYRLRGVAGARRPCRWHDCRGAACRARVDHHRNSFERPGVRPDNGCSCRFRAGLRPAVCWTHAVSPLWRRRRHGVVPAPSAHLAHLFEHDGLPRGDGISGVGYPVHLLDLLRDSVHSSAQRDFLCLSVYRDAHLHHGRCFDANRSDTALAASCRSDRRSNCPPSDAGPQPEPLGVLRPRDCRLCAGVLVFARGAVESQGGTTDGCDCGGQSAGAGGAVAGTSACPAIRAGNCSLGCRPVGGATGRTGEAVLAWER